MLRELLAPPVLALQFLTAVPLPLTVPAGPRHLGRSLIFFPLVGALLGVTLAALDAVLLRVLPTGVASALVLVAGTLLTGGLHLDGLMDTCDGVFGGRTRERRLEIMRDSRVGSYGVLAGALQLLLKYTVLTALPGGWRWVGLVVSLTCGRWAMVLAMRAFPYARPEGLGKAFKEGIRSSDVALATVVAAVLLVTMALVPYAGRGQTLAAMGVVSLVPAGAIASAVGAFLAARLGGLTGDAYGAINEMTEAVTLLALLVLLGLLAPAAMRPPTVFVPL